MLRWLFYFLLALSLAAWFLAGALWVRSYWFNEVMTWWLPPTRGSQLGVGIVAYTGEACFTGKLFRFAPSRRHEYVESMFGPPVPGEPRRLEGDHGVVVHSKRWADEPPGEYEESLRNFGLPRLYVESLRRPGAWGPVSEVQLRVPCWFLVLAAAILPVAWLTVRARRYRRRARGLCPGCGYDLRASPEHCPECGNKASRSSPGAPGIASAPNVPPASSREKRDPA